MSRISRFAFTLGLASLCAPAWAADPGEAVTPRISFTAFHEAGRIERAVFDNNLPMSQVWMHRSGAMINLNARRGDKLMLDLLIGGTYYTATKEQADVNTKLRFFAASVPRFDFTYLAGDADDPYLKVSGGIFQFKYNDYSRNLGEYMFRTGTYPGWISTGGINYVGLNSAQLTGFRLSQSFGSFTHDLIANIETDLLPTYDLTLTYMARYAAGQVFKIGAGLQATRIVPARPSKTNPSLLRDATKGEANPYSTNRYFEYNGQYYADWPEYYQKRMEASKTAQDSAYFKNVLSILDSARGIDRGGSPVDTSDPTGAPLISVSYEHYYASGFKPLAWFALDPKPFFGNPGILGANDLVLYGEAALLGVKDYPVLYDNRAERIPLMIGFNVPAFKLLDVLAVELEYYGSRYPDNFAQVMTNDAAPRPTVELSGGYDPDDWKDDNIKWSVYTQRKIVDGITLSGQVARDHARAWAYPTGKTYWGIIREKDHWHWMLKLTANI
jgi:hypothetical protein